MNIVVNKPSGRWTIYQDSKNMIIIEKDNIVMEIINSSTKIKSKNAFKLLSYSIYKYEKGINNEN